MGSIQVVNMDIDGGIWARRRPAVNLTLLSREIRALLKAGIPLVEAIETLAERAHEKHGQSSVLDDLVTRMHQGQSFSLALAGNPEHFPDLFVASVAASEQTGEIIDALDRFIKYQEQADFIRQKVISAAVYPSVLMAAGIGVGLFLLCFLVPRFSYAYDGMLEQLPFASRVLIELGLFVSSHVLTVLVMVFLFLAAVIAALSNPGVQGWLMERIKSTRMIGPQVRLMQLTRFYRSLGLLLQGGIPAIKALKMLEGILSASLRESLNAAVTDISQGKSLTKSLQLHGMTTPVAVRLLNAGEKNGQIAEMLEQVAAFHDKETEYWIDRIAQVVEPVLMLLIGGAIGGIVVLLYLPIFELASAIQ